MATEIHNWGEADRRATEKEAIARPPDTAVLNVMMPQFSVLMSNYNKGRYVDEAIRSVLAQTFANWELIIVDDASTDDSVERIKQFLGDPRVLLYAKKKHEGLARAAIYGLSKVSSEIVGILDSDDALVPEAIEEAYKIHTERPELGLVLSQEIKCDSNLKPLVRLQKPKHYTEPLLWMTATTHFRTFKLSSYRKTTGLDTYLRSAVDWDLILKLEEVAPVHRIDRPLYMYRCLSSSLSQGPEALHRSFRSATLVLYKAYLRRRRQADFRRQRMSSANMPRTALLACIVTAAECSIDLREPWQGLLLALRGLKTAPLEGAAWRTVSNCARAWMRSSITDLETWKGNDDPTFVRLRSYPVRTLQTNTGNIEPDRVVCIPLVHREGHCLFGGDYLVSDSNRYKATFKIRIEAYSFVQGPLVVLDVYENLETQAVLVERQIRSEDIIEGSSSLSLEFFAKKGQRVEFRAYWAGQCFFTIAGVILQIARQQASRDFAIETQDRSLDWRGATSTRIELAFNQSRAYFLSIVERAQRILSGRRCR